MLDFIKKVFMIRWLWSIIAGMYLVAYAFWIPNLFGNNIPAMILVLAITLVVSFGLLADGFLRVQQLDNGHTIPNLSLKKLWGFGGALLMLGYLLVYIPPQGRIVPHWWLDMMTTVVAGLVMLVYGILDIMDSIKEVFMLRWLWSIYAGFYLMVYALWVPGLLINNLSALVSVFAITVIVGLGLLVDGFLRASELDNGSSMPNLPFKKLWRFVGAALLSGYLLIYIPPYGQILAVAHWPLDLTITIISGFAMLVYSVLDY